MRHDSLPKILYKYKSLDEKGNTLNILRNNELYFPSISEFNDPFEGFIPLRYESKDLTIRNLFKKFRELNMYSNLDDKSLYKMIFRDRKVLLDSSVNENHRNVTRKSIENNFGIFCLTKNVNNFLMWSHYADSHRGICFGFDTQILSELAFGGIWKVNYQKEYPRFKMFEKLDVFAKKMICTKSNVWEYEKEYRFIKTGPSKTKNSIPNDAIKSVTFGLSMLPEEKKIFAEEFIGKRQNLQIFEASLRKNNFEIEIKRFIV